MTEKRTNLKQILVLSIIAGATVLLIWLCIFTPFPVYCLDRLNLRPFFLPNITCNQCNNFTSDFIVKNENFCGNEDVFLLIMVASYHPNVVARKTIRKTWGSVRKHKGLTVKTLFIFGTHKDKNLNQQMQYELKHYGDVVQADFEDKYRTLSNKTMMGLTWVREYCPQAKYILKTDDDAFNVPQRYVDYLVGTHLETFIGGYCFTIMPDRSPSSKFYTPYEMYPEKHYPTYCSGPGYVLSQTAVTKIVKIAPNVQFLPMEDVFVSGMCRVAAGIDYVQIEGTVISKDELTQCNVAFWAKNAHNVVPEEALRIWNDSVTSYNPDNCSRMNKKFIFFFAIFALIWVRILYTLYKKR